MPELDFEVVGAEVLTFAAVPTLVFKLSVRNTVADEPIDAILLRIQIRIEATQRQYNAQTKPRLLELFGEPEQWGETVKSLFWTHANVTVPPFTGSIIADVPIACTYDFEVAGAKYLSALEDGDIPLLFLFSGTVMVSRGDSGMQIAQIPWEKEASFRMPVRLWTEMMDHYFPKSAWLRVRKDVFDRLLTYKARRALSTWDEAIEQLLAAETERSG